MSNKPAKYEVLTNNTCVKSWTEVYRRGHGFESRSGMNLSGFHLIEYESVTSQKTKCLKL